jgi:hypothetical protein
MTAPVLQTVIDNLDAAARSASVAEEKFRREVVERIAALERARAFAFRRLNFVKAIVAAVAGAEDHPSAIAQANAAFLRETSWNGASASQREVMEQFAPVANAIWDARQTGENDSESAAAIEQQLAAFEQWFERNRNAPFLSLMDREVLELPLVEV